MKKISTLLLLIAVILFSLAQGNPDKGNAQLKPVYRITHEGVTMYYEVVQSDSNANNNAGSNSSGSNSPSSSNSNGSTSGSSTYTVESLRASTLGKTDNVTAYIKPLDVVDVSPNPFKEDLAINIHKGFSGEVSVKILDLLGNTAYRQTFDINEDDDLIGLDLSNASMKPGIYILRIEVGGTTHMMRVVKR